MSTPAGRLRLPKASMTLGFGFRMSMRRLCTLISNCSLASLCTNDERFTVYFLISVGRGTGPTTLHPWRRAASAICLQEASITLWSYATMRILNFCEGASFSAFFNAIPFRSGESFLKLFADLGHHSCSHGFSSFTNGKPLLLFHGD